MKGIISQGSTLAIIFSTIGVISGCRTTSGLYDAADWEVVRYQDQGANLSLGVATIQSSAQEPPARQRVLEVRITGNRVVPTHHILRHIRTRPGRLFDPDLLQQDVDQLWRMQEIRRINGPFVEQTDAGVVVTIEIVERMYIDEVVFVGNRAISDRTLRNETGLDNGQPLDLHAVKMAKQQIEEYYREHGYPRTQVSIQEGDEFDHHKVVLLIHEDVKQKVRYVHFKGNTVADDARLRKFINVKPGIGWMFGGDVNRQEIEQDILRLTSYYRSLGYFNARIGRELIESTSGKWLTIHYVIDEGPRYKVRNVSFVGNEKFTSAELASAVHLKPVDGEMPFFNAARMNEDTMALTDAYGSQGYVFVDVQAEPRFLETPGMLDLVYKIEEGDQYRVGQIHVTIDGDFGVTKREVVMNRVDLYPGDLLDTRKLRIIESRLKRAQLFTDGTGSSPGPPPSVTVLPPKTDEVSRTGYRQ